MNWINIYKSVPWLPDSIHLSIHPSVLIYWSVYPPSPGPSTKEGLSPSKVRAFWSLLQLSWIHQITFSQTKLCSNRISGSYNLSPFVSYNKNYVIFDPHKPSPLGPSILTVNRPMPEAIPIIENPLAWLVSSSIYMYNNISNYKHINLPYLR